MGPWITLIIVLLPLALIGIVAVYRTRRAFLRADSTPAAATTRDHAPSADAEREFVNAVAHDLRSPLAAILGYQELLGDGIYGRLEADVLEPVRRIGSSALQVEQVLSGLTEFVRPLGLAPDLRIDAVNPARLIPECIERMAELAAERGVQLRADGTAGLPELRTDPDRFRTALDIALAASIRSSPSNSLVIAAAAEDAALHIDIRGTGFGADTFVPNRIQDFGERARATGRDPSLPLGILRAMLVRIGGQVELLPPEQGPEPTRTLGLRIPSLATATE